MLLYTHALTDARTERGELAVNSFWVSGTGAMTSAALAKSALPAITQINTLREAALNADWAAWAQAWQHIDATDCVALHAAAQQGVEVTLTLCGERTAQIYGDLSGFESIFGSSYYKCSKNSPKTGIFGIVSQVINFFNPKPPINIISLL